MLEMVFGEVPFVHLQVRENRWCTGCRKFVRIGSHSLAIVLQDEVLHFESGLRDKAEHTGAKAAREALIHAKVFWRAV